MILSRDNIRLGLESVDKNTAIKMAGEKLVEGGYVESVYIDAMVEREEMLTTYIGKGMAIPHGVESAKKAIKKPGISILQFPQGVDFDGQKAYLVIGIAGVGNEHLGILANIADAIGEADDKMFELLRNTEDIDYIFNIFSAK